MKQNRTLIVFFSLCALVFGFVPNTINATTAPDVILSEVMWAGSSLSAADEWIELANMSNQPVDVSGWSLAGASSVPIVFPNESLIDPHTTFLISNYAHTNTNSTLNTQPQIVSTMVSIPNDKFTLTLTAPNRGVVDSAGNGGAVFAGKSGGTGSVSDGRYRSMERIDAFSDGTTKTAWADADVSNGFKDNTLDHGTPGILNSHLQTQLIANASTVATPQAEPVAIEETLIPSPVSEPTVLEEPEAVCEDVVIETNMVLTSDVAPLEPDIALPVSTEVTKTEDLVQTQESLIEEQADSLPTPITTAIPLVSTPTPQGTLRISEIYPHPATGESEWIELKNDSMYPVVTNGWSILDASSAATMLPDSVVNPGSFLIIENPKGKLNNEGDSVMLKNADGSLVESVLYNADLGSVPDVNESLVRVNEQTFAITTTPTKNTTNISTPRPPKTTASTSSSTNAISDTTTIVPVATNTEVPSTTSQPESELTSSIPQVSPTPLAPPAPSPKTLRLSELYPNTGGTDLTDEFIEIENTGDQSVLLDGWKIKDAGGTTFSFADNTVIAAHTFKTVLRPETKLSLNNDADTITLIAADGSIVDTQTYEQAKSSLTFARANDVWAWTTTRTPNEPNVVSGNGPSVSTTPETGTTSSPNTSPTTQSSGSISPSLITIEDAKLRTDGARVKVRGLVTALPNTFNSQTMYIQDSTGGVQIFKSDCLFPTLTLGQSITVTGVLSHINGEARLKVMNQTSLAVGSVTETISPTSGDTSSIGSLMTIAGTIKSKSGTRLALNVDGEIWNVDLPKTNTTTYTTGESVQVSGILANAKNGPVLKARSEQDVTTLPKTDTKQPAPNVTAIESAESKQTLAIVLILLSSLAFIGLKLRPRFYALTQSYGRKSPLPPRA